MNGWTNRGWIDGVFAMDRWREGRKAVALGLLVYLERRVRSFSLNFPFSSLLVVPERTVIIFLYSFFLSFSFPSRFSSSSSSASFSSSFEKESSRGAASRGVSSSQVDKVRTLNVLS